MGDDQIIPVAGDFALAPIAGLRGELMATAQWLAEVTEPGSLAEATSTSTAFVYVGLLLRPG
jgi:hypothetical protein